jgi:DnaK suppressor protein
MAIPLRVRTMSKTPHLSHPQRRVLLDLLQSRLGALESKRAAQSGGLSQAEAARQSLVQDADDAREYAGAHEVESILSDIDAAAIAAISSALQRIHAPGYGLCIDCGQVIPFERLKIEPQALRCAACQATEERKTSP